MVSVSHTTDVVILSKLGLKDLVGAGGRQDLPPIGKHQAVQSQGSQGIACSVTLGVTNSSRVDVVTSAGGHTEKECEISKQVAQRVEPQLP